MVLYDSEKTVDGCVQRVSYDNVRGGNESEGSTEKHDTGLKAPVPSPPFCPFLHGSSTLFPKNLFIRTSPLHIKY